LRKAKRGIKGFPGILMTKKELAEILYALRSAYKKVKANKLFEKLLKCLN